MRILQVIDSLEAGGAERMAVNYANALAHEIEFSGLIATRKEGSLLHQISPAVSYLFLDKKQQLDIKALFNLRSYVLKNKVTHIHAHSTSFFLVFLLKLTLPSLKIIRHDHYGNNEFLESRPHFVLKLTAFFFNGVIAVNQNLKNWSELELKAKNVIYFPNFPAKEIVTETNTILKGVDGKRIVSLANLRFQKNHFLLLEIAKKLKKSHTDWSFHLVGKDFEDNYSKEIKQNIEESKLKNNVFLYGSRDDISNILKQSDIAILTSISEGLPVALLEYGNSGKAVIATDVGEIPFVIQHKINGFIVPSKNAEVFYESIVECIENTVLRRVLEEKLFETISEKFSEKAVIEKYLNWMQRT
ncbi:glycosyltransferase [Flavobacterium sp. ACN6]|uniref:glycosyltransferase n=1 Tax=Flavobacterium sp. ACN6 TaxID=1920426 RepID=UPI000BB3BBD0|nr:glycosyltransferase [Flavobacterium sp. ACN6]PBJ13829.1 N,N'-diacetylbacillosaminyl-diphospho-undecaprenol alpha-1,3-N-acetylgalactosaminyltransferase [Flavobacterium sp. ACN6]